MATVTPATQVGTLSAMIRAMFPHERFPDGPYERSAEAIIESGGTDIRIRGQLDAGLALLDAAGFGDMDAEAKLAHLHAISGSTFFQTVRGAVITTLYDDAEVHALLGWEGESFSQGGYEGRGFDDLDWLPEVEVDRDITA